MSRKARTNARLTQQQTRGASIGVAIFIAVVLVGYFFMKQSTQSPTGSAAQGEPTKPAGTMYVNQPTSEKWTVAQGLPTRAVQLAFSAADPTQGYGSLFVNKQEQDIYHTNDRGATWSQVGVIHGPVSMVLSTDPLDPQDVISLSVYAPVPGTYAIQRSLDGGKTWTDQTTTLPVTGEVSTTGWAGSTFLVGIALDQQLQGSSAVVAFPKNQPSAHLDVDGKVNGASIAHLTVLTGRNGTVEVWGDDGSNAGNVFAATTKDLGTSWSTPSTNLHGKKGIAVVASDDGGAIFASSVDNSQLTVSTDDGATWTALPSLSGLGSLELNHGLYVTPHSKTLVVLANGGTYVLANGSWKKATSKTVSAVADGGSQHSALLWTTDTQGRMVWYDA
jgi:hypothetical protein